MASSTTFVVSARVNAARLDLLAQRAAELGVSRGELINLILTGVEKPLEGPLSQDKVETPIEYSEARLKAYLQVFKKNARIVGVAEVLKVFGTVAAAWEAFSEYKALAEVFNSKQPTKKGHIKMNDWHRGVHLGPRRYAGINSAADFLAIVVNQLFEANLSKTGYFARTWFDANCFPECYGGMVERQYTQKYTWLIAAFAPEANTVFNNADIFEQYTRLINERWNQWNSANDADKVRRAARERQAQAEREARANREGYTYESSESYNYGYRNHRSANNNNERFDRPAQVKIDGVTHTINSKADYRKLSFEYHPDYCKRPDALDIMQRINEANEIFERQQNRR